MAVAAIAKGMQDCLYLENSNFQKDWGHSKNYVEVMWRISQQDIRKDFVIPTCLTMYIRDFVFMAFAEVGVT
jgi:GDPmannose 4,6-dehydratase